MSAAADSPPITPQSVTLHRSETFHIELVEEEDGTRIVKKTLIDIQGLAYFYNEFKILNETLSTCKSARSAIRKDRINGKLVMFLEWANGCSLKEWIESNPPPTSYKREKDDLMTRLNIASQIACAVSQVHAHGVVHNTLLTTSIIINMANNSSLCGVQLIDFLQAKKSREPEKVIVDIRAMALLFHKLFISSDDDDERYVPQSIIQLIANLVQGTTDEFAYSSASDVKDDLDQMFDLPEIFLFDRSEEELSGNLKFQTGKIYGRDKDCASLHDAFRRISRSGARPELILVSGHAGTGKSAIVKELCDRVKATGGYAISGKCDRFRRHVPYFAVVNAFKELIDSILERSPSVRNEVRLAVQAALGDQGKYVTNFFPNLKQIIGEQREVKFASGFESYQQMILLFKKFVGSLTTTLKDPIVMVFYDLHWVDNETMVLIQHLVTDLFSPSLSVVGIYRDNEVSDTDTLPLTIEVIKQKNTKVTSIKVGNLALTEMNRFIADQLGMLQRFVTPLTNEVYAITGGNVFFAIQLLTLLVNEELLFYDHEFKSWDWDLEGFRSKAPEDVVQLLASKISNHSTGMRDVLPVTAAVGSYFDESFVYIILANRDQLHIGLPTLCSSTHNHQTTFYAESEIRAFLHEAVQEGYISQSSSGRYKFVHDSIQKAAYSILDPNDAMYLHLKIGSLSLKQKSTRKQSGNSLLFAVDHLNKGSSLVKDTEPRLHIVKCNLQAAQQAFKYLAYTLAIEYLKTGIDFLSLDHWKAEYELSLEIFTLLVECLYSGNKPDEMEKLVKEIFDEARCFADKQRAHTCYIAYLIGKGRLRRAIKVGLEGLAQVGEEFLVFPKNVDNRDFIMNSVLIMDLFKTKYMLCSKSDKYLTSLPPMKNQDKIAAMKILSLIVLIVFQVQPEYLPQMTFRMVRLSLRFGSCEETANAFAAYGMLLGTGLGQFRGQYREGYRFGQLALKLVDRGEGREWLTQVYVSVYSAINHWVMHVEKVIEPLQYAYSVGMEVGNVDYTGYCAASISIVSFLVGKPLVAVEHDMSFFIKQMNTFALQAGRALLAPYHQSVLNLMGRSENSMLLNGEAMNEKEHLKFVKKQRNIFAENALNMNSLWLAYFFGDYPRAGRFVEITNDLDLIKGSQPADFANVFYSGLASFALAKLNNNSKKWKALGMRSIRKIRRWSKISSANSSHKLLLLQAERSALGKRHEKTEIYFNEAIQEAKKNGFLNEEALATERFALYLVERKNVSMAANQFVLASALYQKWGAQAKVDHISELINGLELHVV